MVANNNLQYENPYLVCSDVGFLLELLQGPHEQAKHTPIPDRERHMQPDIKNVYMNAVKHKNAYRSIQRHQ